MKDPLRDKTGVALPEPPYITGGAPYPRYPTDDGKFGISILDYFAAHVMSGLCARQNMSIDDLKLDAPRDAYWIAALMVDLRSNLPITPTPPPLPIVEEVKKPLVTSHSIPSSPPPHPLQTEVTISNPEL